MRRAQQQGRCVAIAAGVAAGAALGVALAVFVLSRAPAPPAAVPADREAVAAASAAGIAIVLSPDALERAGVETVPVRTGTAAGAVRVPGSVAPDGYRTVTVTAASGGRVLAVPVELGQVVRRDDVLVRLHSPQVADAERIYRSALAELEVWDRQLARLDRLVAIGAASEQERDAARSQRVRVAAEADSARAALVQLGRSPEAIAATPADAGPDAVVEVRAAADGTMTARLVNPGENVAEGTPLVTLVDLGSVWVMGDVYERDLARVRVGDPARVTSTAAPGLTVDGRIAYVDPQISETTRTARVRIEVPNRGGHLRLGMLVDVTLGRAAAAALLVPRAAIQTIGPTDVVYVADSSQPGRFVERSVLVGDRAGDEVAILAGLAEGDRVVTRGSFLIRAERDRQHPGALPPPAAAPAPATTRSPDPVTVAVTVTASSFSPETIAVPAGRPIRLVFTRRDETSCGTEAVVPALGIRRALPLNQPVAIDLPAQAGGTLAFQCGMDMLRGQLIVR